MRTSFDGAGFLQAGFGDGGEVDLLELRLFFGERLDVVLIESVAQELAPVRSPGERDDVLALERLDGNNPGERLHLFGRRLDRQPKEVAGEVPLQVLQVPLEDLPGAGEQADLVAELFGLLEDMRRENDRLAAGAKLRQ